MFWFYKHYFFFTRSRSDGIWQCLQSDTNSFLLFSEWILTLNILYILLQTKIALARISFLCVSGPEDVEFGKEFHMYPLCVCTVKNFITTYSFLTGTDKFWTVKLLSGVALRAVASLTVPGGQEFHFPHFSSNFDKFFLFFLKLFSFPSSFWPSRPHPQRPWLRHR